MYFQIDIVDQLIFTIALGEKSIPKRIICDDEFESTSFPDYFLHGIGGYFCPDIYTDVRSGNIHE